MVFDVALVLATLLCSLVAGILFAFAIVVMPGLGRLDDASFIRAFQVIDGVIQNNQPLFLLVWVGSVLAVIAAAALGVWALTGIDRVVVIVAALVYVLGVQAPTVRINIPLNNMLQKLDLGAMDKTTQGRTRKEFEPRWNRWNGIRTACATVTSLLLIFLLTRV